MHCRAVASVAAALVLAVSVAGCGSDDSAPTATTNAPLPPGQAQGKLVELTLQGFAQQQLGADRECIATLATQLSDADAQALVDAYPSGDPKISPAGRAIGDRLLECVDRNDLLDTLVSSLVASAPVTESCVRGILEPLDTAQLAALFRSDPKDTASAAVVDQLLSCRPSTTRPPTT